MNVILRQPRSRVLPILMFVLLCFRTSVEGQTMSAYRYLVTSVNSVASDTIAGLDLDINEVSPQAKHGSVDLVIISSGGNGNPYVYAIQYYPEPGFTGIDTFTLELNYIGGYPFLTYQAYRVAVYPSLLVARNDYATTSAGVPVMLDVLANDTSTEGPLTITGIPLANNGSAILNGNQVVFTPAGGFTGVAYFNYVVCDSLHNCKTAKASIGVNNNAIPIGDTLMVATAKNTPLTIPLTYHGFTLFQGPANGTVVLQDSQVFHYTPNLNFTGADHFVLANNFFGNTFFKTVTVNVLNATIPNKMAMEDFVFTPKEQPVSFNVRDNDIGNLTVKNWTIPANLPGTVSGTMGSGEATFTPNPGFTGVATFYYTIGNMFVPELEMAAVNVLVGNLNPIYEKFNLSTPKETPLVINYQIPFGAFDFSLPEAPQNGICTFYPGFSTHVLNGQSVSGNNLLIYTPNNDFRGIDEFDLIYCVTANGQCQGLKIAIQVEDIPAPPSPFCVGDCVWAGDVNNDGIVNNKDLLPLGYYMGFEGTVRPDAALEWYGQHGIDWDNPYTGNAIDLKYADTDGNGFVSTEDTAAIGLFYGQTHNLIPDIPGTGKGLPFFLNLLTPNPGIGDLVEVEVDLGSPDLPVTNLYGFTFDVALGQNIVVSDMKMDYYNNSWLNQNAPSLWMDKSIENGRLETAFTRTDGVACSGYGTIGKFEFIVIDIVIAGKPENRTYALVQLKAPTILWADGKTSTGDNYTFKIPLRDTPDNRQAFKVLNNDLFVYPSPASDVMQVHLNGPELIESLTLFNSTGQAVFFSGGLMLEHTTLNVQNLPDGVYVASARTTNGVVNKKFQILH